jgi:hypothetical protein
MRLIIDVFAKDCPSKKIQVLNEPTLPPNFYTDYLAERGVEVDGLDGFRPPPAKNPTSQLEDWVAKLEIPDDTSIKFRLVTPVDDERTAEVMDID